MSALVPVFAQNLTGPPTTPSPTSENGSQPKIIGTPEIIIDRNTGTGSQLVSFRNSDTTKQLKVSLTGVVNTATTPKPRITFRDDANSGKDQDIYQLMIAPNSIASVTVVATNATQVGEFEVELRNGDELIGKAKIIHFPFAVTLDGPSPNKAEVSMVDQTLTTFTLKNDDPVPYPVIWRLRINGVDVCGDQLTLPRKGLALLQCRPSLSFRPARVLEFFKVEGTEGHTLLLYPQTAAGLDNTSPSKIFPVKASLSYFRPGTQVFGGYVVVFIVLLAGGLASLFLNHYLPNRLKRLNVRERVKSIRDTTINLSSNVGSDLQVLLRLERRRLSDLLESRMAISPDFAGIVTRCGEGTDTLERRVALVQQMDILLGRLHQKLTLDPPASQIFAIEALIEEAKVLLKKTQLTAKDLEAAQTAISDAEKKVDALNQADPAFGPALVKRVSEVHKDIKTHLANSGTFEEIAQRVPGPFNELDQIAETSKISPARYAAVDTAVEKMILMKDYTLLRDGTTKNEVLVRLRDKEDTFLDLLQLQSWPAMRSARLLLREMQDDVYPERFKEKLRERAATIVMDPAVAYDQMPLQFCVCFHEDAIDQAAAREEWTCEWAFGDELQETGWTVSHYYILEKPSFFARFWRRFTGRFKPRRQANKSPLWNKSGISKKFNVQVAFRDSHGDLLKDENGENSLTLPKVVTVYGNEQEPLFGDRARTEFLKLMVALLIAVFALVAGAREQFLKLDILPALGAVFMLGFGADTIKNLLTKSESG